MKTPKKAYDVAVLGWWYGKNYGSILTYYGLNRAIKGLGHSVLMVHEPLGYNGYRVDWPDDILSLKFARRVGYDFTDQFHYSELPALNAKARTFVVGSDQLWNPLIGRVNDDLFLDFVRPDNSRVAYATSFGNRGTEKFKPAFIGKHAPNLQKFKAISVREEYAIGIARDVFGVNASLVVDPVFLLTRDHYAKLAKKSRLASPRGKYLSVFFLDPNPDKVAAARAVAGKLGLEKILVIPNPDEGRERAAELWAEDRRATLLAKDAPENFLRAYKDAAYVVTDSYHGSCFAAIFGKPFSSVYNTKRGADRFKTLMDYFGLGESRRIYESDRAAEIEANENVSFDITLTAAQRYIEDGRTSSLAWLRRALDPDNDISASVHPIGRSEVRAPAFAANNSSWVVRSKGDSTDLRVSRGGAARGNHVWTELPAPGHPGAAYRVWIDWTPRSDAPSVNVHVRNPENAAFKVIGKVGLAERPAGRRTDVVEFRFPEEGYTQLMLGALHFTGRNAGAEVHSVRLEEVPDGWIRGAHG